MIYFIKSGNVSGHGLGASAPDIVAVVVVLNADDTVELQLNTPVSIFSLGTKQNIKIKIKFWNFILSLIFIGLFNRCVI